MEPIDREFAARLNAKESSTKKNASSVKTPNVVCAEHGALGKSQAFFIHYASQNGEEIHAYCLRCLTSYLDHLISSGILPRVTILD